MFGKHHSKESCEKMSETRSRKWIDGEYKTIWKQGDYFSLKMKKDLTYRSSWELEYFKYLDKNSNVKSFISEEIMIPYYDDKNGKKRHYIPDLLIEYNNGNKELVEIKSKNLKNYGNNKLKFKAAREYCKQNGLKFKILTENYLKRIGCKI